MNNDPAIIKINNVRLSFPALFQAKEGPDGGKPAFSATFILDKKTNAKDIAALRAAIAHVVKDGLKGKTPPPDKLCLKDGSTKPDLDGYGDDVMFVPARSPKRPGVVNRDLTPLTEEDGKPYAGCYVNATVRLWAQDNKFGKRVNAALRAVQFLKDGEPFGEKSVDTNEEFEAVEDESVV